MPHAVSNLLSRRVGQSTVLGRHLVGAIVDLNCHALGQFLQPIFLRTL
jgi:hypothetical protein